MTRRRYILGVIALLAATAWVTAWTLLLAWAGVRP